MRKKDTKVTKFKKRIKKVTDTINLYVVLQSQIHAKTVVLENLSDTTRLANRELKKIAAITSHTKEIYGGLEEVKTLHLLSPKKAETKAIEIYKKEIERLEQLSETYRNSLAVQSLSNPVVGLQKPRLTWTLNPRVLAQNIAYFKLEKKEWRQTIKQAKKGEVHISLGKEGKHIKLSSNGTTQYKPEHLYTTSQYVTTDDKLIATYYLADIPAFLSDDVLFKLATSHLPFTMSIFIESTDSQELIKKAKQRLSVLELKQAEKVQKGKLKDQQTEKSIEEISQFIYELVHEYEKGFVYSFYLSLEAQTKEEMKLLHKEFKNFTDRLELSFTKYIYGQKQAFETMLPFGEDKLRQNRILQSSAVGYLTPFVAKQIHDPQGIFLGVNRYHNSLVFVNPFTMMYPLDR